MSTSDAGAGAPTAGQGGDFPLTLGAEIARLANELFGRSPLPAVAAPGSPGVVVPANPGPSAAAPGAGGVSTQQALPPIPGPAIAVPIAQAPAPRESDLRLVPAQAGEAFGVPARETATVIPDPSAGLPYFLQLAGLGGLAPMTAPGSATSAVEGLPIPTSSTHAQTSFAPELVPDLGGASRQFDPYSVKADFPILSERVHGQPLIWLDNAATTQKPRAVIDRLKLYYERENSNIHRAAHALAARATDAYEGARETVRRFLNASTSGEIVFVRGATEAINLVAQSWGRRHVGAGDEIVISWLEHHANIVPWQQLAREKGATLRVAPVDERGQVRLDEYEKLLGPRTRLVAFTQVSNALGTITPAREMIEMAHRHGARVLLDGAQAVSHLRVDVQSLGCDFYCFSGHKVFGPTGIGALFGKADVLNEMPPWQGGGNMIADVTFERTLYQPAPMRFEAGTGNIADAVGLAAALDYLSGLGIENVTRHEHELLTYATDALCTVPGLTPIGTAAEKAGVLSFVLDGQRTEDVGAALDRRGIAVRSGHHCAQPILRRFGKEATVRASLAPYNTKEDIDALRAALVDLQRGRDPGIKHNNFGNI